MKKILLFAGVVSLGLLLSACDMSAATPTPQAQSVISSVQTSVASTFTAVVPPTPTLAPTPVDTEVPTLIPSLTPLPPPVQATSTPYATSTGLTNYGCEDATFVRDMTITDGQAFKPGDIFVKTWKVQNTGSCVWGTDFFLAYVSGDSMNGSSASLKTKVDVSKRVDVSVTFRAPSVDGYYSGYWQMTDGYGHSFGDELYVKIYVSASPTSTGTPTKTPTPTRTTSPTPTKSPTPTATGSATSAPTQTHTPTPTNVSGSTPTPTDTTVPPTPTPSDTPVPTVTPTP